MGKPLTPEQARRCLLERAAVIDDCEEVPLELAAGRVLAEDVYAEFDQPPFARSPLDGYAVRSRNLSEASMEMPVTLTVIGEVDAGHTFPGEVEEKEAVRIMTGAPIPRGADCVVAQEHTDYGEKTVRIFCKVGRFQNYCFQGEDYQKGSKLLGRETRLGAVEIGVLAGLGKKKVSVLRRVRAAVLTTGDEIVLPGEPRGRGEIYDSNLYMITAMLREWGACVTAAERVGDDVREAAERIRRIAETADVIITTGGVSVGKKDIMHEVLQRLACEQIFWKIAMKPGMPTLCGMYQEKLLICLSGNPFAAAAGAELLVRPVLAKMALQEELKIRKERAVMENEFLKASRVRRYVRARISGGKVTIPKGSNDSGVLSNLCGCNCLIEIPAGTNEVRRGEKVWVILL